MNERDATVATDMAFHMKNEAKAAMARVADTMDPFRPDLKAMATVISVQLLEQGLREVLCSDEEGTYHYEEARRLGGLAISGAPKPPAGVRDFDGKTA